MIELLHSDHQERYPNSSPKSIEEAPMTHLDQLFDDFAGYAAFGAPALVSAELLNKSGCRVFVYEIAHESPFFNGAGLFFVGYYLIKKKNLTKIKCNLGANKSSSCC